MRPIGALRCCSSSCGAALARAEPPPRPPDGLGLLQPARLAEPATGCPRTSRRRSPRRRTATSGSARAAGWCGSTASASSSSTRRNEPAFKDDSVYSLRDRRATARCGPAPRAAAWSAIGTARSAASAPTDGLTNLFVRALFEDRAARSGSAPTTACSGWRASRCVRFDGHDGVPTITSPRSARIAPDGSSSAAAACSCSTAIAPSTTARPRRSPTTASGRSARAADGAVWIGTVSGLRRLDGRRPRQPVRRARGSSTAPTSACLYESPSGQMWVAHLRARAHARRRRAAS